MFRLKPPISQKLLSVVLALSFLGSGCGGEEKQATGTKGIPVKLQTLKTAAVINSSNYVGTLEARQRVNLAPRINGRILEIFVKEGDPVRQGEPIVKLEPTQQQEEVNAAVGNLNVERARLDQSRAEVETAKAQVGTAKAQVGTAKAEQARTAAEVQRASADLATAQANVEDAKAELTLAEINYKRSQFLVGEDVQPKQDLDDKTRDLETKQAQLEARLKARDAAKESLNGAKESFNAATESLNGAKESLIAAEKRVEQTLANVDSQKAAVKRAGGQLGSVGQELAFNTIVAPIDGVVGDFNEKKVGDFLDTGESFTTITDNQVFLLNTNIPTEYRSQLRRGLPVEIINPDGTIGVRGQVTYISPSANQQEQSILTKITFRNDGSLKDREYVRVRVIWNQKPGVLVPTSAVTKLGGQSFVFVAEPSKSKDGKETLVAKQKPVVVGNIQGQSYPVVSGVRPGEQIAVSRILDLKDGTPITEESIKSKNVVDQ